jgi:hypothetical protein
MRRRDLSRIGTRGSVLLITLVVVGLISALTISFAGSMATQLQVARDQTAAMHAELSAQSGLEYAERQLLLDPLWVGTDAGAMLYTDGSAFDVLRLEGQQSKMLPTLVKLEVVGIQSAARTCFLVHLRVDPGDPLLDKAVSVLGDIDGANLRIDGDYLILDAPGWLWSYRPDLEDDVLAEQAAAPPVRDDDDDAVTGMIDGARQYTLDKRSDPTVQQELNLGFDDLGIPDDERLADFSDAEMQAFKEQYEMMLKMVRGRLDRQGLGTTGLLLHVREEDGDVEGVWVRTEAGTQTHISLSRIDSQDTFHNFSKRLYAWAQKQEQVDIPVHAPGWDLEDYLVPNVRRRIYDHVTDLHDVDIQETAVFILDPDEELHLENVHFGGGMVVYCEDDFDFSGPPRNRIYLAGDNSIGNGGISIENEALIAPGCAFTVLGTGRHSLTGFSLVHSLVQVRRFHHDGVLIILNSAEQLFDSEFDYDRNVAVSPPDGLIFFGNLPSVDVELQLESADIPLQP